MGINVNDLPPKYQAQAMRKYLEQQRRKAVEQHQREEKPAKESKYKNSPTERMGEKGNVIRFDSQKEARRYDELIARLNGGEIRELRMQVDFTLQEAYTDAGGKRVRAIRYRADFTYFRKRTENGTASWEYVVEDVKSKATKTRTYEIKKKMLQERFGYEIEEV